MIDRILWSDPGFFVVDKPAGVLSQKDKSGDEDLAGLLKAALCKRGEKADFLAPVHRLDRNTSGLLILARDPATARMLTDLFKAGKVEKTYLAVVKGDPGETGRYEFRLKKDEKKNQAFVSPQGDEATTIFHRREKMGSTSLVEVKIETGRSHQIRAHFAAAGHPLIGDKKYGKKPWSEIFSRPALHAWRLEIPLPQGRVEVEAPFPEDMADLFKRLGGKAGL